MAWFRLNIDWSDNSQNTLVYKYPFKNGGREVNEKSTLTVRDSQCAVFVHKGQVADVFGPGFYELKTATFPILSKLFNWKYAFENPIVCDVYFVNTKQFTNIKWGTKNPIIMRDTEFGSVRVRGFGSFAFKVDDPTVFLKELFGTNSTFKTEDISDYLKTLTISSLTDAIGESKVSILDMAGNTLEFNQIVRANVQQKFKAIGLKLVELVIENFSLPQEVEKRIDERSGYGILAGATDTMMKVAAADAMRSAAANEGNGGAFMGAGVGIGAGVGVGSIFADAFKGATEKQSQPQKATKVCPTCKATVSATAKFCEECGSKIPQKKFCAQCGKELSPDAKFCPECGNKA